MRPMLPAFLVAGSLVLATPGAAQTPYLVKDINPAPDNSGSYPDILGVGEGLAYFSAAKDDIDRELWRTDGTAGGTWQLADLCPEECSANPRPLKPTRIGLFFTGYDGSGVGLWITQGDPASTVRLTSENTQFIFTNPKAAWDDQRGLLFFVARDSHGDEVWRTDGTPAGTWRVTDVNPRQGGPSPDHLTLRGNELFFCGNDDVSGSALWATDGTARGTRLVKSFGHPPSAGGPWDLRVVGSSLVFLKTIPSQGLSLWRSDGSTKGTVPLLALGTTKTMWISSELTVGSRLFFTLSAGFDGPSFLCVTNGSTKGTRKLGSFLPQSAYLAKAPLGGRVVFAAADATHGGELWITDGTTGGTRLLKDICPGTCSSNALPWIPFRQRLVVIATTPEQGTELWTTDGTAAGTRIVRDICPGACSSSVGPLGVKNGRLIFFAGPRNGPLEIWSTNGNAQGTTRVLQLSPDAVLGSGQFHGSRAELPTGFLFIVFDQTNGQEPWFTDGTTAGTGILRDLNSHPGSSAPQGLMPLGSEVFFFAGDRARASELWKSDGTAGGTRLVTDEIAPAGAWPHRPARTANRRTTNVEADGRLFFQRSGGLWGTDGTREGTLRVTPEDLRLGSELAAVGNRAFFNAGAAGELEREIWVSDGTTAGTRKLGETPTRPERFTAYQGRLYFVSVGEIWASDGTPGGTGRLPAAELLTYPEHLTVHKGLLYFFASGPGGDGLWKTDGTTAGTALAVAIDDFSPVDLISAGDKLFLLGYHRGRQQNEIWVSDSTPAGTFPVGGDGLRLDGSTSVLNGVLYISTYDGLWRSDGTVAGTSPLELSTEEGGPVQGPLVAFGNRLYTFQDDALIQTDGTSAGTHLIRPSSPSWRVGYGSQNRLVPAGPHLFFSAYEEETGEELWALPATP